MMLSELLDWMEFNRACPRSWLGCVDRPGLKPLGYIATPHEWGFGPTCMYEKAPFMGRRTIAPPFTACPEWSERGGAGIHFLSHLFLKIVGKAKPGNRVFHPIHLYKNLRPPVLVAFCLRCSRYPQPTAQPLCEIGFGWGWFDFV